MDEWIERIGKAKAFIDNGMCRVGPGLDPTDAWEARVMGSSSRSLALADAVIQLCRHGRANEALVLVRHLAELAVGLRWAAAAGPEARRLWARELPAGWEGLWSAARLEERARAAGVNAEAVAEALEGWRDFALGSAAMAPWSHVYAENLRPGASAESVLRRTAWWMSEVLAALDAWKPGHFQGRQEVRGVQ